MDFEVKVSQKKKIEVFEKWGRITQERETERREGKRTRVVGVELLEAAVKTLQLIFCD